MEQLPAPVNGNPITFSGTLGLSNTNDIASLNVAGMTFDNTAGAFNVSGNSIQLSGGIANSSTATQTIGLSMTLAGTNQSLNAAAGNFVVNGVISDGGSGLGVTTTGTGTVTLAANNTYTGPTTIKAGTLAIGPAGSIAAASTIIVGGGVPGPGAALALAQTANRNNLTLNGGRLQVGLVNNSGTGGTITYAGGNVIHTFTTVGSSTWTVPTGVTSVQSLVVGGGGGGQNWNYNNQWNSSSLAWGGGGGGGGFYYTSSYTPSGGTVTVTVGAGGAASDTGNAGSSSVFDNLIAYGGGIGTYGGAGGASGGNNQGGLGYAGGPTMGGGGGAGQAGQGPWYNAPNNNAGNGLQCAITGTNLYYGGGGASFYNGSLGGLGGGGSTDDSSSPTPGMQNGVNGLGGGGASGRNGLSDVGAGGSGVVIVSYASVSWLASTTLCGAIAVPVTSTLDAVGPGGQITVNSTMTGAGGIAIDSSSGPGGVVVYSAPQSYQGDTTIKANGTLQMGVSNGLPYGAGTGNLYVNGTLDLDGMATTNVNGLWGGGLVTSSTAGAMTLVVGNSAATSTFSGVLQDGSGTLSLTKTGAGTLILSGSDQYSGRTFVDDGDLVLTAKHALGDGPLTVEPGAALIFDPACAPPRCPCPRARRSRPCPSRPPWRCWPPGPRPCWSGGRGEGFGISTEYLVL